jgi:hypothetical protein
VRLQVGVDEGDMAELVVGVVVDVHVHVLVQYLDLLGIGLVPAASRNLAVLDTGELVVLLPEIGLDDLCGTEEAEDRCISTGKAAAFGLGVPVRKDVRRIDQQPAHRSGSDA